MTKTQQKKKGDGDVSKQSMPATVTILPVGLRRTILVYQKSGDLTESAAAAGAYNTFRLNSVYDPDFTGAGSTAIGYTSMSGLYGLFRVVRARVIIRCSLNTTGVAVVGFLPGLNSTFTSSFTVLEAEPHCVSKMIVGNVGGAHGVWEMDRTFDLASISGLQPQVFKSDLDFAHSVGSNPARSVFGTLYVIGNAASAQTLKYSIRIAYDVQCSQPSQSAL